MLRVCICFMYRVQKIRKVLLFLYAALICIYEYLYAHGYIYIYIWIISHRREMREKVEVN